MAKRPKSGRPTGNGRGPDFEVGQLLSCRIDTDRLAHALNRYFAATRPRPSKTAVVLAAVEDYLTKHGFFAERNGDRQK
jgi:hypothetical protein